VTAADAAKALQSAVDDVDWARNSGDGKPDLSVVDSLTEAANGLLRELHMQGPEAHLGVRLVAAVTRISYQLTAREPEAIAGLPATLLQAMKVQEEAGELAAAMIGLTGQNPRKGVTHTYDDAALEAVDVIMSALVFLQRIRPGLVAEILGERLTFLEERAAAFGAPPVPEGVVKV
jgi:hypothetical protein